MSEFKYRKASLNRLSASEQLDHLMKVTASKDWIILAVIGSLTVTALLWSIFGQLPIRVNGQGILIRSGGIFEIVSLGSGQITEINVDVDGLVATGDIIARISQPIQHTRLKQARAEVGEMKQELQHLRNSVEKSLHMQQIHSDNERINLMKSIDFEQERLHWLREKQASQDILMQQGLITKQSLVNTKQEINTCKERIENDKNRLQQLAISNFQMKDQKEREIRNSEQQLLRQQRDLQTLEKVYEESTLVISPYTGRILEVTADIGKSAHVGDSLMSLELSEENGVKLEAVIFVSPAEGKKVQPGMNIHISPSTVKSEEYGFMLGLVSRVSEFPATTDGMMRLLHNQNLVQTLTAGGAPIQIHAELLPDSGTQSGFAWSSSKGPPTGIHSGTVCSARIVISEKSPIHLLIPYIKKNVLGE
jgi:HlyD family secretion protein